MNHLELSDDDEFVIVKDWYKVERQWRCHVLVNHPGCGWREMDGSWTQVPKVNCIRYEEHHTEELECVGLHANIEHPNKDRFQGHPPRPSSTVQVSQHLLVFHGQNARCKR